VALDDLGGDRKPQPGSDSLGLRREERLRSPSGSLWTDAGPVVDHREADLSRLGAGGERDPTPGLAGLAGVEKQVDEGVLEQIAIALHERHRRRDVGHERHVGARKPVFDRCRSRTDDLRRVRLLHRGRTPSRHVEEPPDDVLDAVGLIEDSVRVAGHALVPLRSPQQLLGPANDDAERRRHLVRDTERKRAHRRDTLCPQQLLVALLLRLGHGKLALQLELLALFAERGPAERDDQTRRDEHAQHQPPNGSLLPITLARRGRHRDHAPSTSVSGIDAGDARHGGARRKAQLHCFVTGEPQGRRLPVDSGLQRRGLQDAPVHRPQRGVGRRRHEHEDLALAYGRAPIDQVGGSDAQVHEPRVGERETHNDAGEIRRDCPRLAAATHPYGRVFLLEVGGALLADGLRILLQQG